LTSRYVGIDPRERVSHFASLTFVEQTAHHVCKTHTCLVAVPQQGLNELKWHGSFSIRLSWCRWGKKCVCREASDHRRSEMTVARYMGRSSKFFVRKLETPAKTCIERKIRRVCVYLTRRDTSRDDCGILRETAGYRGIQLDSAGFPGILRDTEGYCGICRDTAGYCGILRDLS
jgi:hypothetical protein